MLATVENYNEYEHFDATIMEQLLSSKGRFLFPYPKFKFTGLDADADYRMSVRFDRLSCDKFSFVGNEIVKTKHKSRHTEISEYHHHSKGEQNGEFWMREGTEFVVKVTNNPYCKDSRAILLDTQCKYQVVLQVTKVKKDSMNVYQCVKTPQEYKFDCLQILTTTRYNNKYCAIIKGNLNKWASRKYNMKNVSEKKQMRKTDDEGELLSYDDYSAIKTDGSELQNDTILASNQDSTGGNNNRDSMLIPAAVQLKANSIQTIQESIYDYPRAYNMPTNNPYHNFTVNQFPTANIHPNYNVPFQNPITFPPTQLVSVNIHHIQHSYHYIQNYHVQQFHPYPAYQTFENRPRNYYQFDHNSNHQ